MCSYQTAVSACNTGLIEADSVPSFQNHRQCCYQMANGRWIWRQGRPARPCPLLIRFGWVVCLYISTLHYQISLHSDVSDIRVMQQLVKLTCRLIFWRPTSSAMAGAYATIISVLNSNQGYQRNLHYHYQSRWVSLRIDGFCSRF